MITIRNQRLLRMLGFEPAPTPASRMVAGMSLRLWLGVIGRRIIGR